MKMNRSTRSCLWTGSSLLAAFLLWTLLIMRVDVQAVGPNGTVVGFAAEVFSGSIGILYFWGFTIFW